jgi:hypothetical protein
MLRGLLDRCRLDLCFLLENFVQEFWVCDQHRSELERPRKEPSLRPNETKNRAHRNVGEAQRHERVTDDLGLILGSVDELGALASSDI